MVVAPEMRKVGLGSMLVERALEVMHEMGADECVLEAESTNAGALRLYENLGFIRDKRLRRYYLSGTGSFDLSCASRCRRREKRRSLYERPDAFGHSIIVYE